MIKNVQPFGENVRKPQGGDFDSQHISLPYLTFGEDVTCRRHPAIRPPGGPIALPR